MLSVYLEPFERAIAFQVTNQNPQITDYIKQNGIFRASNGWTVTCQVAPELDIATKTIYLRGSNSNLDKRVDRTWDLKDNYRRDKYINEADQALKELVSATSTPRYAVYFGYSVPNTNPEKKGNMASNKPLIN
jgi:hypothetical protein